MSSFGRFNFVWSNLRPVGGVVLEGFMLALVPGQSGPGSAKDQRQLARSCYDTFPAAFQNHSD